MNLRQIARPTSVFASLDAICLATIVSLAPALNCLAQEQESDERSGLGAQRLHQQLVEQRREAMRLEMEQQQRQIAEEQRAQAETQLGKTRAQIEEKALRLSRPAKVAPQERVEYRVYTLKYLPALGAVESISPVFDHGPGSVRLSADYRANSLIAAGSKEQLETIGVLLQNLDVAQAAVSPATQPALRTLQLRMIWVLDGPAADETANATKGLDSRVSAALAELGFEHPTIVCQPVASMVVGSQTQGQFKLEIPVVIGGSLFTFSSTGQVDVERDDRFAVHWNARILQAGIQGNPNSIVGSVLTPLDHYTVLGTSMVVSTARGEPEPVYKQYRSAFVVNLTKADDRPVKSAEADQLR